MAKTMNQLGKRISDEGLKFGVHAHLWTQLQDRQEIDQLMDLTDPNHVYLVLDTGHINMAGIDPVELASVYASRIVEFHLKDCKPEDRGGHKGPKPVREGYADKGKRIFYELGNGGVDFPGIQLNDARRLRRNLGALVQGEVRTDPAKAGRLDKAVEETLRQ